MKKTRENYADAHEKLMYEWLDKYSVDKGDIGFAIDGIVDTNTWFSLSSNEERVLILLKEAYDKENRIWSQPNWIMHKKCTENCKHLVDGESCKSCKVTGHTFNPISEWLYGISQIEHNKEARLDGWLGEKVGDYNSYYKKRDELLKRIAIVNIKKPNGVKASIYKDIEIYAKNDKDMLKKQIKLINPTLIICGNTYDFLRIVYPELPKLDLSTNGCTMIDDIKVVATYHPNHRRGREEVFNQVIDNYRKILK